MELVFTVAPCPDTGGFVARWDAPAGGGICTQGDTFAELQGMVMDAVRGYFDGEVMPETVLLHFTQDPVLAVA
jgi:predicted RNase H-like HicB family nuclease